MLEIFEGGVEVMNVCACGYGCGCTCGVCSGCNDLTLEVIPTQSNINSTYKSAEKGVY